MKKFISLLFATSLLFSGLFISGCTSHPNAEQLKQLDELKASVQSLEKQIADKKGDKATLEKQIAEKNGKLQQCQSDQEAVKKGLGN